MLVSFKKIFIRKSDVFVVEYYHNMLTYFILPYLGPLIVKKKDA